MSKPRHSLGWGRSVFQCATDASKQRSRSQKGPHTRNGTQDTHPSGLTTQAYYLAAATERPKGPEQRSFANVSWEVSRRYAEDSAQATTHMNKHDMVKYNARKRRLGRRRAETMIGITTRAAPLAQITNAEKGKMLGTTEYNNTMGQHMWTEC